jgi:hypothetical protein
MVAGNVIPIQDFNLGGLADSKWSGIKNSLYRFIGFDPHSVPGILRTAQKLTKDSGVTVTEYCKARVASSNGCTYWFSSVSGKIWERTSAGVWSLVYTMTAGAGGVAILGAYEYENYIYIATESRLHRISSTYMGATDWSAQMALNWATFTKTDALYHPMVEQNLILFIGDGNQIAQVDGSTFTANALDIKAPLRVKSLGKMGTDLLIGTWVSNNITKTTIYRWNTWSVSFTVSDEIDEVGINAFLEADNGVYVQAGLAGNIYIYDGEKLELYKKITGDYLPTKQAIVNPAAVANLEGQILFGVSNVTGNPCDQGVYRIGKNSRNYPYIMDLPYPISPRLASDALVLSGVEIGAILTAGSDVFVSWQRKVTVTMTIADPGVVTYTAHGLTNGDAIVFTTTGALPTGITTGTIYFARSVTADTLHLYDTSAHAVSGGATGRVVTTGTQSGVHTAATVGIDKLDYSNKLNGAFYESRVISVNRETFANFTNFVVAYASLPASTAIAIAYSKNYAAYVDTTEVVDTQRNIVSSDTDEVEATTLQMRVTITTNSNDAPEIESSAIFIR